MTAQRCSWDKGRHTWYTSKAFAKVWHEDLLYKLKQDGISNLLNVIDFCVGKNRVVLIGQHSSWASIKAGVPQGYIIRPSFFLIYINDLSDGLTSNPKLFVDDTSVLRCLKLIRKQFKHRSNESEWLGFSTKNDI